MREIPVREMIGSMRIYGSRKHLLRDPVVAVLRGSLVVRRESGQWSVVSG